MPHQITDQTFEIVRQWFKDHVQDLLDDPHGVEPDDIKGYIGKMLVMAADLGLDFDAVCQEVGTDYERARLRKIEEEAD